MQKDLFSAQQPVSEQSWLELVNKDLKGAGFEERLVSETDGLKIQPLYTSEDIPVFEKNNDIELEEDADELMEELTVEENTQLISWNVCEEVMLEENDYLNDVILPALRRGCNYIHLKTGNWDKFFDEIRKIEFPATFALQADGDLTEEYIVNTWRQRVGFIGDRDRLIHAIEFDPVSYWMQHGKIENEYKTYNNLADMFFRLTAHLQDCKIVKVDVSKLENKPVAEQLATALSITTEYFDKLSKREVPVEELIHLLTFKFSVGNNYFLEIAKLRAFKILWLNLVKAFLPEYDYIPNPYIHVITSFKNYDSENKHNNLIKRTTQTMSAILGGADVVSVSSNDEGDKNTFRIGTNIQNLLRYESYLDKYRNAAEGSFYLETITIQLAEQAWKKFQQIENGGGIIKRMNNE